MKSFRFGMCLSLEDNEWLLNRRDIEMLKMVHFIDILLLPLTARRSSTLAAAGERKAYVIWLV